MNFDKFIESFGKVIKLDFVVCRSNYVIVLLQG